MGVRDEGTYTVKYGFIIEKGEEVIPVQYDIVSDFYKDGLAAVSTDGKKGFINEKGEEVIKPQYEDIASFKDGKAIVCRMQEETGEKKYGCINEIGEEIIPFQYDEIESFSNGWAAAKTEKGIINNGEPGYACVFYDEDGNTVLELDEKYYDVKSFNSGN